MIRKNIFLFLLLSLFSTTVFSQKMKAEVSITNINTINTAYDDFIAIPYGDGIMYNSHDKDNKCDTCSIQNLRFASKNMGEDCSFSAGIVLPNELVVKHNYGAPTFSADGKMMILSENNKKPRKSDRKKTMKLITSIKSDRNSWLRGEDLPFNSIEFETTHPSLSADGQTLYFASDRPGGVGGMDIWKVTKEGETWGTPSNLGASINSAGKDLFPAISTNGTLSFSSDRAGGLGGLDIYTAAMENGAWATSNLGAPFNSGADDLGYVELADGESGYLTSNRTGGQGKDDIYCWKINPAPVNLAVKDAVTNNSLPGSKINIVGPVATMDYIADGDGAAQPAITFRRNYALTVEKEGYKIWTKTLSAKELASADPYIVLLDPKTYQIIGDVKLVGKEEVVPGAKIVLHNLTTGEKGDIIADANGKFTFDNIRCFENYELIAYDGEGDNARESEKYPLTASMIDCASEAPIEVTLRLPEPKPVYVKPICPEYNTSMLGLPLASTPKTIRVLGSRPQFGSLHDLDATGFYNKLKSRYDNSSRDAAFLDELFTTLGYANGFADVGAHTFYGTTIPNGMSGNMGYTTRHRIKYVQLNAKSERDLQAFRVASINGCDVYFMKTCGNFFFFRQ